MRSFHCTCGNRVFFENTQCLACHRPLGWCPACADMTALLPEDGGRYRCAQEACGALLVLCHNYAVEQVCNRCCPAPSAPQPAAPLCDYCRFNDTIPDLSVPGNREKWARLESAKRRLLYALDQLRLPYGTRADGIEPPLSFDFKADVAPDDRWWWSMGQGERVFTGHADGKITINLREADTVEREKARVDFHEAHRTIIGHFRHEIAHYYWQMLVQQRCEPQFQAVFGDHRQPSYAEAQQHYYRNAADWPAQFVSAYASMHPWEDFAETFATYLDMVGALDTAGHFGIGERLDPLSADLSAMVDRYINLGVVLNEMNRTMGLIDVVPEILAPPIVAKLEFIHQLIRDRA
jgi:hypothetical protein